MDLDHVLNGSATLPVPARAHVVEPRSAVEALPLEIVAQIVQYLDRPALRHVRPLNKAFASLSAPLLFDEIHLSPNDKSFERAAQIAGYPHLACHVHSLQYHVNKHGSWTETLERFRNCAWSQPEQSIGRLGGNPINELPTQNVTCSKLSFQDVKALHEDFLQELRSEKVFYSKRTEVNLLRSLMSKLSFLNSVAVLDNWSASQTYHAYLSCSSFAISSLESMMNKSISEHLVAILQAAYDTSTALQAVKVRGVGAEFFGHITFYIREMTKKQAQSFRALKLAVSVASERRGVGEMEDFSFSESVQGGMDHLLAAAENLETLSIEFDPWHPDTEAMTPVLTRTWKHLRDVELRGVTAGEDDMINFFSAHAKTLRRVRLASIAIESDFPQGSILSFFVRLRECTHLEIAQLRGNFTNHTDEAWYVPEDQQETDNCLRRHIEQCLTHRDHDDKVAETELDSMNIIRRILRRMNYIGTDKWADLSHSISRMKLFSDESWVHCSDFIEDDSTDSEDETDAETHDDLGSTWDEISDGLDSISDAANGFD